MRKTLTSVRCVPRFGFENTQVRLVDLELPENWDEHDLRVILGDWFQRRRIDEAIYDVEVDDDGYFAIVNDEAYESAWGEEVL